MLTMHKLHGNSSGCCMSLTTVVALPGSATASALLSAAGDLLDSARLSGPLPPVAACVLLDIPLLDDPEHSRRGARMCLSPSAAQKRLCAVDCAAAIAQLLWQACKRSPPCLQEPA